MAETKSHFFQEKKVEQWDGDMRAMNTCWYVARTFQIFSKRKNLDSVGHMMHSSNFFQEKKFETLKLSHIGMLTYVEKMSDSCCCLCCWICSWWHRLLFWFLHCPRSDTIIAFIFVVLVCLDTLIVNIVNIIILPHIITVHVICALLYIVLVKGGAIFHHSHSASSWMWSPLLFLNFILSECF